jgi:alpha-L-fucosidase
MIQAAKRGLVALSALICTCVALAKEAPTADAKAPASVALSADPPAFVPYVQPPQKAAALKAWREASFGLFLHFGVYSTFGGEYQGRRSGAYAEWLMQNVKIPLAEYRTKVAGVFNPTQFNADEWVQTAKAAGMRYIVITSKHHDGFAMWDSKVTDYNVVAATPFKRDVIGELRAACRKQGILFGLYYSQSQDWSHPGGQNNIVDFPWQPTQKGWWRTADGKRDLNWAEHFKRSWQYVNEKAMPQLEEIITKYDPVGYGDPAAVRDDACDVRSCEPAQALDRDERSQRRVLRRRQGVRLSRHAGQAALFPARRWLLGGDSHHQRVLWLQQVRQSPQETG